MVKSITHGAVVNGKRILLIIGGGIAAYKSLDLVRRLRERGAVVRVVLTAGACQFITPLAASVLSGQEALTELFDPAREARGANGANEANEANEANGGIEANGENGANEVNESAIGHIGLSRAADVVVVAPATANLIAKMAHGLADDLASAVLLARDKPLLIAPAMNVRMWEHPATRRNLAQVIADGAKVIGPEEGAMACGEWGPGRMAAVETIVEAVASCLSERGAEPSPRVGQNDENGERRHNDHALRRVETLSGGGALGGRHVLVTAGPTIEPIDPVRYIANRSSGRQGYAIARAAQALGAHTTLVTGPTQLTPPRGVEVVAVETAQEMLEAVEARLAQLPADIAVFAAAVADWRPASPPKDKIKKGPDAAPPRLALVENPDILATIARLPTGRRPTLVIGFAAETSDVVENAQKKRRAKGADWIVANDVSPERGVFGGARNTVHLVTEEGVEDWPELSKDEVAHRLMALASAELGHHRGGQAQAERRAEKQAKPRGKQRAAE